MTTWYGWAGTILYVDLTKMKVSREPLTLEFAKKYIGGSGFGVRILYDEVPPGDNALEPENVIIIGQGPLSATAAPSGGRYDLISKSPLTGIYARSNGGGFFGPEMKWAGYDLIVVRGKAEKPVYLWIDDDQVELRDASHLWGKDVWTARRMIQEELGDPEIQTLMIGPAGENICLSSCVISNLTRAAGRMSIGAVWGSKRLKAVAVRGSKAVSVAKPKEFMELCKALNERAKGDPLYQIHTTYGSTAIVSTPAVEDGLRGPSAAGLHHKYLDPLNDRYLACFGCALHCSHYYSVKSGKYKGTRGEGVEGFTVVQALQLRIGDMAWVCKYNTLCNQLGLHVDTPGAAISWAMQLYEDGIITKEDTDGLELTWGNEDAVLELTRKMAYKEGFGEVLDGFPIRSAQKVGRGSELYTSHVKGGASHGATDMQRGIPWVLATSVATRGRDHLTGASCISIPGVRRQISEELLRRIGQERYNDPEMFLKPFAPDPKKALHVYDSENINALSDMTGICKFGTEYLFYFTGIGMEDFAQLMSTATGVDFSIAELTKAAEREFLLERSFNARERIRRIDDYPPALRYELEHGEKHPRYDYSKYPFGLKEYDDALDEYYKRRGCDLQTGIPTRETLEAHGLKDVADDLASRGILPQ